MLGDSGGPDLQEMVDKLSDPVDSAIVDSAVDMQEELVRRHSMFSKDGEQGKDAPRTAAASSGPPTSTTTDVERGASAGNRSGPPPSGFQAFQAFTGSRPGAVAPLEPFEVIVPPNARPGGIIAVITPDGQRQVQVRVPVAAQPGMKIRVNPPPQR